jgi:uncharacterized protein YfaS (alpha-2-macroglobulin family)
MKYTCQLLNDPVESVHTLSAIKQIKKTISGTNGGAIHVTNKSKGMLFVRIISAGIPTTDDRTASQSNLILDVKYKTVDGKELNPVSIPQGTDFYAEVFVKNISFVRDYSEMALNQLFPSGWEIMNSRLDDLGNQAGVSIPKYQDIRDDRVYTFFDMRAGESRTFRVYLNASYLGRYFLPTLYCEAMYDASIHARIPGQWVTVTSEEKSAAVILKK